MQIQAHGHAEVQPQSATPVKPRPPWLVFMIFLIAVALVLALYGWSVHSGTVVVIELLVAAASSCAGALFGFVFGIPRGPVQSNTEERLAKPNNYRPSNSLEQVTEWLTKILVGAGLIELAKISGALNAAGIGVAGAFNSAPSGTAIVTKAVIVSFVVYGFLVAFLWTRIYYSRLQALGDKDIWDALNDARQQAIHEKESKEEALSLLEGVAAGAIPTRQAGPRRAQVSAKSSTSPQETDEWPDEVRAKVEEFKNAPNDWNDDTAGRIFRGASQEAHGKILEGEIVKELRSATRTSGCAVFGSRRRAV